MAEEAPKGPPGAGGLPADPDLAVRAAQGDRQAFRLLVERHHAAVFAVCRRRVRDDEEAMELTQDVFLDLHRALPGAEIAGSVRAWLVRQGLARAERVAHDPEQRLWRQLRPLDAVRHQPADRASPDRPMLAREREEDLKRLLAEMPRSLREAFLLREQQGLDYDEVAQALGIHAGAARMRVMRAREWLMERFGGDQG